nr:uncharacterized protein LOC129275124 [Lytechinus pictus]
MELSPIPKMLTYILFIYLSAIAHSMEALISSPCAQNEVIGHYKTDPYRSYGRGASSHGVVKAVCLNPEETEPNEDEGLIDTVARPTDIAEVSVQRPQKISDVRLVKVNTIIPHEGYVQVLYIDQWQFVCGRYWSFHQSSMTCHSLGYIFALPPSDGQTSYRMTESAEKVPGILHLICPGRAWNLTECDGRPVTNDQFLCEDNRVAMVTCEREHDHDDEDDNGCLCNPCSNDSLCILIDVQPGYFCACSDGSEGEQCETSTAGLEPGVGLNDSDWESFSSPSLSRLDEEDGAQENGTHLSPFTGSRHRPRGRLHARFRRPHRPRRHRTQPWRFGR